jgi:D-alanyl-D-alanine dipeptidase
MRDALPIPYIAGLVQGWQAIPIRDSAELLVAIGRGTDYDDIVTSAVYAGEHLHSPYRDDNVIDAAMPVIYVRESVAERLRQAQASLPEGLRLIVFDGYRSVAVQQALFDQFLDELRLLKPDWNEAQLVEETERYVAVPSTDVSCPSPHSTGGAVDVAIVMDGRMIEFGTPFDHGSARSALRYFEDDSHVHSEADRQARDHRRLLYYVMHEAGFEGFEHEWWHYNARETQMGARAAGCSEVTYGIATELLPKSTFLRVQQVLLAHEQPSAPIDRIAPAR